MSQVTLAWPVQNMTRVINDGFVINVAWACTAFAEGAGGAGTIAWDADYIYACTATNTWKRVAIATW